MQHMIQKPTLDESWNATLDAFITVMDTIMNRMKEKHTSVDKKAIVVGGAIMDIETAVSRFKASRSALSEMQAVADKLWSADE